MLAHRKSQQREHIVDLELECGQRLVASRARKVPHAKPVMGEAATWVELECLFQGGFGVRELAGVQASLTEQTLHGDAQGIECHSALQQRDRFVVAAKTCSQDRRMA